MLQSRKAFSAILIFTKQSYDPSMHPVISHDFLKIPEDFRLESALHCVPKGPFLGMDWGKRRVGLAISDPDNQIALPLKVVASGGVLRGALSQLWDAHTIKALVIGWPCHSDGKLGALCPAIHRLALRLQHDHGWPICFWDERFTSRSIAALTIDRKEVVDHHAAAIILQGALDRWRRLST